jgi:ABC-type multidrug transport system permease subunit
MPDYILWISKATPITLPSISLRYILLKDADFLHPAVLQGFAILLFWILVFSLACFFVLKRLKFVVKSK